MFAILNGAKVELIVPSKEEATILLEFLREIEQFTDTPVAYTLVPATDEHVASYQAANGMRLN